MSGIQKASRQKDIIHAVSLTVLCGHGEVILIVKLPIGTDMHNVGRVDPAQVCAFHRMKRFDSAFQLFLRASRPGFNGNAVLIVAGSGHKGRNFIFIHLFC